MKALDGKKVHGKSWWFFFVDPAPFAFYFLSLLDGEVLGDLRFALCCLCLLFFCAVICHPI